MLGLLILVVVIPTLIAEVIKFCMRKRDERNPVPVQESEEKQALAEQYATERFESAWRAIEKHECVSLDDTEIPLTPELDLLEDRLSRTRNPYRSEIGIGQPIKRHFPRRPA